MHFNLAQAVEVRRVVNATAAGTTTINGSSVDTQGYDGVAFIALFGALTATQVTSLKAQQSSDDGSTDSYDDLAGSGSGNLADGDGNKVLVLEVFKPAKRYVRPVILRGTANAAVDGVIALLFRAEKTPVPTGTTVAKTPVQVRTPAEGTP
jgi:hypothetical protein